MRIVRAASLVVVVIAGLAAAPAAADPLPAVTSRDYAIDLYDGVALGNSATIAMGGASAANAFGTSGTLVNASAPAVRRTTDTDSWSWDYHLDYLYAGLSKDYDNNGQVASGSSLAALTLGLGGRWHDWGIAVTGSTQNAPVDMLTGTTSRIKLAIAKWVPQWDMAIGVASNLAQFSVGGATPLFTIQGGGVEAGATWVPYRENYRLGAAVASRIIGGDVTAESCDPNNCEGFILPDRVEAGGRLIVGGAYRWAPEPWNQLVGGTFRDERAVTVASDIVITGSVPHGYGLEAFGEHELQRSGKNVSYSLRGGVEYEWLPGRLRLRGGSYWEPGRFDGVSGRLHGTFGIEVRAFEANVWGRRRGRVTLTGDIAERYRNLGVSIGFWH
jgi:hypothetical protein